MKTDEYSRCRDCRQQTMSRDDDTSKRRTNLSSCRERIRSSYGVIVALVVLCNVIGCQAQRNVALPPGECLIIHAAFQLIFVLLCLDCHMSVQIRVQCMYFL